MSIFKRAKPRTAVQNIRESLWPSMGWARTWHYYNHRIFRGGDSTRRITAGLALGAAVSHSPFLGTHFIQAVFFAFLFRVNPLAAFAGTVWGNPWTFPFIFWLSYKLGVWVCGLFGISAFIALPDDVSLSYLFAHPLSLLLPLTVGGYLSAIMVWPIAYGILYYPVYRLQRTYRKERLKRVFRKARRQKKKDDKQK